MRTILITGGASGLGRGVAFHYLAKGDRVIAVGNSVMNGAAFISDVKQIGAEERAVFIPADLSLVKENKQVIEKIDDSFTAIDALIFCASRHCKDYSETAEGFEFSFALDYLSRFVLSYGLKKCLEKAERPVIMNICGAGMKGNVNWDDLQHKSDFDPMSVMMHGSRLNELSATSFVHSDGIGKIKYILYNPMAVKTPGMMEFANTSMKLYYKLAAKPVEKAVIQIAALLDNPPEAAITAYTEQKKTSLNLPNYNKENANKLYEITVKLLDNAASA